MKRQIFRGLSIQVLDDNAYYASLLKHELTQYIKAQFGEDIPVRITSFTDYRSYLEALPLSNSISFIDFYLDGGMTGPDLLQEIRERCPYCKVIIMTDQNNVHVVSSCIKEGAGGFVFKDHMMIENCYSVIRDAIGKLT
jgi:DNA-binding NtrC family response regulator